MYISPYTFPLLQQPGPSSTQNAAGFAPAESPKAQLEPGTPAPPRPASVDQEASKPPIEQTPKKNEGNGLDEPLNAQELEQIRELVTRDRQVRAHERAHVAAGGQYASAATYIYQQGPNGRRYAVGGEVQISVSPVPDNPQATLAKADQVRRAALAPVSPSAQDRSVAGRATQLRIQAQVELALRRAQESQAIDQARAEALAKQSAANADDQNPATEEEHKPNALERFQALQEGSLGQSQTLGNVSLYQLSSDSEGETSVNLSA